MRGYFRQPVDDGGNEMRGDGDRASDPQFSGGRIGQEIDVLHALLQLVEGDGGVIQQRARIDRGLDAARIAIEQPDAERGFYIGDGL